MPTGPAKASIISFPRDSWVEVPRWTDTKGAHHPAHMSKLNAAFKAKGNLPSLFDPLDVDGVHPNDAGYDVIADAFFKTITGARSASASRRWLP